MEQKLNSSIAHAYYGALVMYENEVREVYGVNENCIALFTDTDEFDYAEHSDCQLLLTPLSEISDEDAVEVVKIALNEPWLYDMNYRSELVLTSSSVVRFADKVQVIYSSNVRSGKVYITKESGLWEVINGSYDDNEVPLICTSSVFDFLRSKSYDVGHGSIPSLISARIAINKNQVK
jgi:hypothetical protein